MTNSTEFQQTLSWLSKTNRTERLYGMNRFLCEPNSLMLNVSTWYQFSQKLGDISVYILPILALAGNSLTLLVFLSFPQMNRSSFSVYVKSMAVSDTLVLVFKLLSYLNKTYNHLYFPSMCTILIFCGEASVLLSIWTIVLITIERTFVVLFPLHTKNFFSTYRARLLILLIAILTIIFSTRVLIIPIDTSSVQRKKCHPKVNWHLYIQRNATVTEFGYCYIPLTIVIIGNFLTLYTVKRALFRRRNLLTNNSYKQKRQMDSNENQLMLMLLVVTLMFIVYFVPFTIVNVIARWGLPFNLCFTHKSFEIYLLARALSELLKDLNFCTNFIIYCISGRRFRCALLALFNRHYRNASIHSKNCETTRNDDEQLLRQIQHKKSLNLTAKHPVEESQC